MRQSDLTIGLYRHFKGGYYFIESITRSALDYTPWVHYFDVLHPERGTFVRPMSEFLHEFDEKSGKLIKDREDNITGQHYRFQKVLSLDNEVKNLSTETLLEELRKREDSPLQDLDIVGVSDRVFSRDWCVGEVNEKKISNGISFPRGVYTIASFTTLKEALSYFRGHSRTEKTKVFKRVFIEEEVE